MRVQLAQQAQEILGQSDLVMGAALLRRLLRGYLISRRWVPLSWRLGFGPCLGTFPSA